MGPSEASNAKIVAEQGFSRCSDGQPTVRRPEWLYRVLKVLVDKGKSGISDGASDGLRTPSDTLRTVPLIPPTVRRVGLGGAQPFGLGYSGGIPEHEGMSTVGTLQKDGRTSSASRGYGHRWRLARNRFLTKHPLCRMCQEVGRVSAATLVDHIRPHRGNMRLFWDMSNWQALCAPCHDGAKQKQDISGKVVGCGVDGLPLDHDHPWNRD